MTIHQTIALGPQFADLADDTEDSILGSSTHLTELMDERERQIAALEAELRRLRKE